MASLRQPSAAPGVPRRRPGKPKLEDVLAELTEHRNTKYDPMVIVHLKAILRRHRLEPLLQGAVVHRKSA